MGFRAFASLLAAAALMATAAGCGGGSGDSTGAAGAVTTPKPSRTAPGGSAEREAPKGASPVLKQIYRQFPPPLADPTVKGSAEAIRAGRRACRGKTPVEVKERFWSAARARLNSEQEKMIRRISSYERHASSDSSFVAGQLAADVYEAAVAERTARYGYQGCVYSLARGLERRLAP